MNNLTSKHRRMLSVWQQHLFAEFELKSTEAAIATMTENPHVLLIPSGTGGVGNEGVRDFYANHFIPNIPPDFELIPVSQVFAKDRIVEELVVRFTHTLTMDWMLPGLPPTDRKVEYVLVAIIQFENGKVAGEHLYWDQATVLSQLGVLDTLSLLLELKAR
jgi:carboxymethylenebutenolidase